MRFNSPRQFCMSLWNIAGALHNPYGIRRNSYMPKLPTVKAVYCWDFPDICTCQNPDFRSMLEKNRAPTMDSMVSCIRGRGNESFLVLTFNFRKSMQNCRVPSFFSQGLWRYTKVISMAELPLHPTCLVDSPRPLPAGWGDPPESLLERLVIH